MFRIILLMLFSLPFNLFAQSAIMGDDNLSVISKSLDRITKTPQAVEYIVLPTNASSFSNEQKLSRNQDVVKIKAMDPNTFHSVIELMELKNSKTVNELYLKNLNHIDAITPNLFDLGASANDTSSELAAPVPEPVSLLLIALGLFLVWLSDKREDKNKK